MQNVDGPSRNVNTGNGYPRGGLQGNHQLSGNHPDRYLLRGRNHLMYRGGSPLNWIAGQFVQVHLKVGVPVNRMVREIPVVGAVRVEPVFGFP